MVLFCPCRHRRAVLEDGLARRTLTAPFTLCPAMIGRGFGERTGARPPSRAPAVAVSLPAQFVAVIPGP
ncbi:hypothetical protein C3489_10995 [Streptomyces sp. Ru71]|nr:hypothetical protein C3489_10995 [Streptomyces sp. Ru71]